MDYGNEAEERGRDAKARVFLLEGEVQRRSEELHLQKRDLENQTYLQRNDYIRALNDEHELSLKIGELGEARMLEDTLLESGVSSMNNNGEAEFAQAFLEAYSSHESCKELLQMWYMFRPSTQKVLSLAATVKKLEKDKELCRINLCKAEDDIAGG